MLTHLRVRRFAIIDQLEVGFGPGLNVVTGAVDLVVTDWASSGIAGLGTTKWLVYPNLCPAP